VFQEWKYEIETAYTQMLMTSAWKGGFW